MKLVDLLLMILMCPFVMMAQQNQWIWINGGKTTDNYSCEFGLSGVPDPENWPQGRLNASSVVDEAGVFWLLGGHYFGSQNGTSELWNYDPTNHIWTFKKGLISAETGNYSKGINIESYRNFPTGYPKGQMWASKNYIYYFSGYAFGDHIQQEFWRYNRLTGNWTQLSAGLAHGAGNYGIKGVESDSTIPPKMYSGTTWTDHDGNLWLFGGKDYFDKHYNALWKYNITTNRWVWLSGDSVKNRIGSYSSLGIEDPGNKPGARINAGGWVDSSGNIWLFGGSGPGEVTPGGGISSYWGFNDTWKFNPQTNLWTWMKGSSSSIENIFTTGTEHPANLPSGTYEDIKLSYWMDLEGNFWFYEASQFDKLWKYNPTSNNWAIIKNVLQSTSSGDAVYGSMNIADPQNTPSRRSSAATWTGNDGRLYLFSGQDPIYQSTFNDLWCYNIDSNTWMWINGCTQANWEGCRQSQKVIGIPENENTPGKSWTYGAKWQDSEGNLWLYNNNGDVYPGTSSKTHLWKYFSTTNQWQWINGKFGYGTTSQPIFGILGIENRSNQPGTRLKSSSWLDNQENLWLFGGRQNSSYDYQNDLWKYNRSSDNWVWVSGNNTFNVPGIYGTQGSYGPNNVPGSRWKALSWVDSEGNFWLYGGEGFGKTNNENGKLNDLWKYNILLNQWMWVKGSDVINNAGSSSGINVVNPQNNPPSGNYIAGWNDNSGNFWLYCGQIWKYDILQNIWILKKNNITPKYGLMGVPDLTNAPSIREGALTWSDHAGNLWLFGGEYFDGFKYSRANDLWIYDIINNTWTWISGTKNNDAQGMFGTMNVANYYNLPPNRKDGVSWCDPNGNLYLFGGNSHSNNGNNICLGDLWIANRKYNTIIGKVRFDRDNDGCDDNDLAVKEIKLKIQDGDNHNLIFTDNSGNYIHPCQNENISITPDIMYYNVSPVSETHSFNGYGNVFIQDFCITAEGNHNDLEVTLLPLTVARPGFSDAKYKLICKNVGTTTLSGNIIFQYDENRLDFETSTFIADLTLPGELQWNLSEIAPFENKSIEITMKVNSNAEIPPVFIGDTLHFVALVIPVSGDETPENNSSSLSQRVVGSLDPNDKSCIEGEVISSAMIGKYLHYLIRFENDGTWTATNIVVDDLVDDQKFDLSSIRPVASSHDYKMSVTNGNKVEFIYNNINLPFYGTSKYGYILFKIQTKDNTIVGDTLRNTANIYFDYNLPIITNEALSFITKPVIGIEESVSCDQSVVYPNPFKNEIFFSRSVQKIMLYDISGRLLQSSEIKDASIKLDHLGIGTYFLKIFFENSVVVQKIIKE